MATKFQLGKGSTISISTDGTTFTLVKQGKTITYSGQKTNFEDITNLDSPGNEMERVPTTNDPGTAAMQGVHDPADPGQLAVRAAQQAQTLLTVKHQFSKASDQTTTGLLRTFSAYVADVGGPDAQYDKSSTFSFTYQITGPITDTPGV